MILKTGKGLLTAALAVTMLTACSKAGNGSVSGTTESVKMDLTSPVTLTVASGLGMSVEDFNKSYGDKIKAKFPNVTLNFIARSQGTTIPELVTAGIYPDIVFGIISDIDNYLINLNLHADMAPLIKKHNYDLNRFEPILIDAIKTTNPEGNIIGLPMPYGGMQVMFYNKSIFDKFGVPYPKDGMTWDQTYELAKQMTRVDGGDVYRGFGSFYGALLRDNQLSVPYLDPKADKMYDPEKWKVLFNNFSRFYQIQNNKRADGTSQTSEAEAFEKSQKVALNANQFGRYAGFPAEMNWDMVTMPTFKEAPNTTGMIVGSSGYWYITKTNKNQDISFKIIEFLLSDEMQIEEAKTKANMPSVRTIKDLDKIVGSELPALKGKNIGALTKMKPAAVPPARAQGLVGANLNELKKIVETTMNKIIINNVDINTALREAEEAMAKQVEAKKAQ
ncbi:ABC transporter substrate-binding protein [Paenibacillus allorhizosphaerae]|uniref:Extracellular solute-binding protein n=1 Tax=Paenibacillus allorhizosphaerae TaxID=2849866 RepID=A0ABN7TR48_9BACL|nr:ABC transporter substrate-binding protein [Paenibacillus allorhizosphaerae]CAG7652339.1 hypothetical protein PAECIP111802_05198 [Paenibacillus allorhizosphaerae]